MEAQIVDQGTVYYWKEGKKLKCRIKTPSRDTVIELSSMENLNALRNETVLRGGIEKPRYTVRPF
jgi:hypothetical protein